MLILSFLHCFHISRLYIDCSCHSITPTFCGRWTGFEQSCRKSANVSNYWTQVRSCFMRASGIFRSSGHDPPPPPPPAPSFRQKCDDLPWMKRFQTDTEAVFVVGYCECGNYCLFCWFLIYALGTATCLQSVSYSSLLLWLSHTEDPTTQTQNVWLSLFFRLWTSHFKAFCSRVRFVNV